ncbi:hypothetical protein ACH49M_33095, partial [Rhodococcus qingshengii]
GWRRNLHRRETSTSTCGPTRPADLHPHLGRASFDTASLSTDSLEELNLGKISELLKLGITAVSFITALNSLS